MNAFSFQNILILFSAFVSLSSQAAVAHEPKIATDGVYEVKCKDSFTDTDGSFVISGELTVSKGEISGHFDEMLLNAYSVGDGDFIQTTNLSGESVSGRLKYQLIDYGTEEFEVLKADLNVDTDLDSPVIAGFEMFGQREKIDDPVNSDLYYQGKTYSAECSLTLKN